MAWFSTDPKNVLKADLQASGVGRKLSSSGDLHI